MYNGSALVSWNPNSDTDLAGYKVYVGSASTHYDRFVTTTDVQQVVTGLDNGLTWFFSVTAVDTAGNESTFSAEGSKLVTVSVLNLLRTVK
jgi:hypothetical protein